MRRTIFWTAVLLLFLWHGAGTADEPPAFTLEGTVRFTGQQGDILLALATEKEFHSGEDAARTLIRPVGPEELARGEVSFRFEGLPPGTYCIKAFQDVNGDRKLEIGRFGPKEPWGFYRPSRPKFRGPRWEEVSFPVDRDMTGIRFAVQ